MNNPNSVPRVENEGCDLEEGVTMGGEDSTHPTVDLHGAERTKQGSRVVTTHGVMSIEEAREWDSK
ncbi:MAG: hypothetical protein Q7S52_00680 [bacterium]|nr:hypothetical protein [bacterium]